MTNPNEDRWREIDAIFAAALEQEPSQRNAFLARACRGDQGLRQAVAALLQASARAESFLETPIFTLSGGFAVDRSAGAFPEGAGASGAVGSDTDPPGREAARPLRDLLGLAGRQVSHFRVHEVLSCGGMGVVYRGHDLWLGRTVALKFLLPQYSLDASAKERFLQEARAASLLDHPNICTVHETGETEEGHLFLAMACYGGETLGERLARAGTLPIDEALELARQIVRGLGAAHAAGIVHRDLKPANLMLTAEGTLKILDFGLAKVRDLNLTRSGERAGTVAYMSPEQLQGGPVDGRSDLWSLGVVLYEMLTGKLPFGAGHEISTAYRILHEEPAPLSSLRPEIPAELEVVAGKLLRKEPAARYASATEVLQTLEAVPPAFEAAPVAVQPRTAPVRNPWRLRRITAVRRAALVAGIALLAGVAGSLAMLQRDRPAEGSATNARTELLAPNRASVADRRSVAVLPFVNLSASQENEYFSDGITDEILTTLARVGDLRVISRTSVMQYKSSSKPLRQIAAELSVSHVLEGSVQRAGERIRINAQLIDAKTDAHLWAERYDRPLEDILALQSEIAQHIAQALEVALLPVERERMRRPPTSDVTAYDLVLRGREYFRRYTARDNEAAIQLFRRAVERDPKYVDAHIALADAYRVKGQVFAPPVWKDSAVAVARRAVALDPLSARAHNALGWALDWHEKLEPAREAYLRAIELDPDLVDGLANLSHHGFGRMDEAIRLYRRALAINPTDPILVDLTGWALLDLGMVTRARHYIERAVEVQPIYMFPYMRLARLHVMEGRPADAEAQIPRMLDAIGENPSTLNVAGRIAATAGNLTEAKRYFQRNLDAGHAVDRVLLAWVLQQLGESSRALDVVRELSHEAQWSALDRKPESIALLAKLRILEGNRAQALRLLETAVQKGWSGYYTLPTDPILNSLRGDPRFDRLMAEVKADVDRQRARVEREGW